MAGTTLAKLGSFFNRNPPKATKQLVVAPRNIVEQNERAEIANTLEAVDGFPICVLLTGPVLAHEAGDYTVKSVTFVIKSNDQGWCNEDNFEGQYEGSWTWFEVVILRPLTGKDEASPSPRDEESIDSEPCIKQTLDKENISDGQRFFIHDSRRSPFWHLQRNRRGNDKPFQHTIVWNQDSEESTNERLGWDFNPKTGAGSGVDFVRSLQRGDRIAVIARAKHSGSVNYVSEATIVIQSEGSKPANTTNNMRANSITASRSKRRSKGSVDNIQRLVHANDPPAAPMSGNGEATRAQLTSTTPPNMEPRPARLRALGLRVVSAMRWSKDSPAAAGPSVDSKDGEGAAG